MKLSQFHELMAQEFGREQSAFLLQDTALQELSDDTGAAALRKGVDPGEVWRAICVQLSVPKNRWHGQAAKKLKSEN